MKQLDLQPVRNQQEVHENFRRIIEHSERAERDREAVKAWAKTLSDWLDLNVAAGSPRLELEK